MLTSENYLLLESITDNELKIGIEYNHPKFLYGSFDFYFNNIIKNTKEFRRPLKILSEAIYTISFLKDTHFNNYNDTDFINPIAFKNTMLDDFFDLHDPDIILESLEIFKYEWENFAKIYKTDISKELKELNIIMNDSLNFQAMIQLKNELKFIKDSLDKLHIIRSLGVTLNINKNFTDPNYKELYKNIFDFFNDPTKIINNIKSMNDFDQFTNYFKNFEKISNLFSTMYTLCKNNDPSLLSQAERFLNSKKTFSDDNDIKKFIFSKDLKSSILIMVNTDGKQKNIIIFNDKSILTEDQKGNYKIINNNSDANKLVESIYKFELSNILRKNPSVSKLFIKQLSEDLSEIQNALVTANTYLANENILKNNNDFNLEKSLSLGFEKADDTMSFIIREHKIKQYAESISSNKYKFLYNEESYKIIKELYEGNVDIKVLQSYIGKKIAAYKTPEDFNKALTTLVNGLNEFTYEIIKDKALKENIPVVLDSHDLLVLEIKNFEQSKILGSGSWCISRSANYFESYTSNNAHQYFIYDLTKNSKENDSLIGLTLKQDGAYSAAHLKNDNNQSMNDFLTSIQLKIVTENPDVYPDINIKLKELIESLDKDVKNKQKLNMG